MRDPTTIYKFLNVTADAQVKAGAGRLHAVTITTPATTAGTITLYDSLAEDSTVIAAIRVGTSAERQNSQTLFFDCRFTTGLYVGYDAVVVAAKITVSYI